MKLTRTKQIAFGIIALGILSACQLQVDAENRASSFDRAALITGYSKAQLISCAGRPASRSRTDAGEVWQYVHEAYKDPELNPRGDFDSDYIGLTYVYFENGTVSNVRFGQTPERSPLGFRFTERMAASLSTPVLSRC